MCLPSLGSFELEKMYKLDLPVDQTEMKAAERRRSAETTRKARIFNTRHRVMGIDVDALNQQVQEKKHQQNMEMQRDKAFGNLHEMRAREGSELTGTTESPMRILSPFMKSPLMCIDLIFIFFTLQIS